MIYGSITNGDTYFVNETDLYYTLSRNEIRGAFLDVVKDEPINRDNKLLSLDNVYISPHIANALYNSIDTQVNAFKNNLNLYKSNKQLKNLI